MTSAHSAMVAKCLLALSDEGCLAFDNPTRKAWIGQVVHNSGGIVTLKNAMLLQHGLCIGSSDIIMGVPRVITADMVGQTLLIFGGAEVKTGKAVPTKEQKIFRNNILHAGGIAGIVHNRDEARALIR